MGCPLENTQRDADGPGFCLRLYGRGFSEKTLRRRVQLAELFPDESIVATLSRQLTWSPQAPGGGEALARAARGSQGDEITFCDALSAAGDVARWHSASHSLILATMRTGESVRPGDVVGDRFSIEHLAGTGGMGTVYRARDARNGAAVALKLLQSAGAAEQDRFAREIRVLAQLEHPGVVRYVAHGATAAGEPYLVMEWLDGEDLAQRLSRAPLTIDQSLALARRVAEALGAVHALGVVHRDIKPSNLFLPGGEIDLVKILDFGIARMSETSLLMTRTGHVLGTPAYMAPEQARGEREIQRPGRRLCARLRAV